MDWETVLQDAGVITFIATAIFLIIDFIKKLYYKLPWKWVEKTPGEVWFALSIALGIVIAMLVYWDNFFGGEATLSSGLASTIYGLVSGAGSKLINSIASSAGAKLKATKEEARLKAEAIQNTKSEFSEQENILSAAPISINDYTQDKTIPLANVCKEIEVPEGYYVLAEDGTLYKIKGKKNE